MRNKKKNKNIKIIAVVAVATTLVFVSALVIGLSLRDSVSKGIEVKESSSKVTFEVSLGTHSIDLTEYKDIRKFVELRTDSGVVITEGFEWVVENAENHHINGILKIKNNIEEKPIIGQDTKSFKLIFKNIPDEGEREHLYEGEKLN